MEEVIVKLIHQLQQEQEILRQLVLHKEMMVVLEEVQEVVVEVEQDLLEQEIVLDQVQEMTVEQV